MKEDVSQEGIPQGSEKETLRMDRRSFLLTLSGGAFALAASGLLTGCGGGSNATNSTLNGNARSNYFVAFQDGQTGLLSLNQPSGSTVTGTLAVPAPGHVLAVAKPAVTAHTTSLANGTYTVSGTTNSSTGQTTLTGQGLTIVATLLPGGSGPISVTDASGTTYNGTATSISGSSSSSTFGTSGSSTSSSTFGTSGSSTSSSTLGGSSTSSTSSSTLGGSSTSSTSSSTLGGSSTSSSSSSSSL